MSILSCLTYESVLLGLKRRSGIRKRLGEHWLSHIVADENSYPSGASGFKRLYRKDFPCVYKTKFN